MEEPSAHYFGVIVTGLDQAAEFYQDVFGLSVLDRFSVSGEAFLVDVDVTGVTSDSTTRFPSSVDRTRLSRAV